MTQQRKIIHVDMDAFFASVEQRDFPQYKNKPLVVGGSPQSRGVVAAASYEARKYGIHSAMPSSKAHQLCPHAIFVKPRFNIYKQCSEAIRRIFYQYSSLVEPLSLDEAYIDVSNCSLCHGSATLIAQEIKQKIRIQLNLTASAGVSYNKFLAKLSSDMDKPDGLFVIKPGEAESILEQLNIRQFHGIGSATEKKMKQLNIFSGKELKELPLGYLKQQFGKNGQYYYNIARGIDHRDVMINRPIQSISSETTFPQDLMDGEQIKVIILQLTRNVFENLQRHQLSARTCTLKVRYKDFQQITRSYTHPTVFTTLNQILSIIDLLVKRTAIDSTPIRLLGVCFSSLQDETIKQLQLT